MIKFVFRRIVILFCIVVFFSSYVGIVHATNQKYCYASPSEQYPGKEIAIHWNYEYPHETIVRITDRNENTVFEKTLPKSSVKGNFQDNVFFWYGWKANGSLASPGYYKISLIPNDEYRNYPSTTSVTLLEQPKEPAKLSVTIQSPTTLTINGNDYVENTFTVTATIHNSGEESANNVEADLNRSSGLWMVDGGIRRVSEIPGGESRKVFWKVKADTKQASDRTEKITVTVTSANTSTVSKDRIINVPGLVVIFIPGLMGTDLYSDNGKVWYNFLSPNDYKAMQLNNDGTPVNQLKPEEPMKYAYEDIINFLINNHFNVKTFPYDWRLSNEDSAQLLADKINKLEASKVYIVAHSMGGLVANRYIGMGNANKVAKLITIGTPYMGSPKALYGLEMGDLLPLTNDNGLQQIAVRSRSAYQLLPSREYFNLNTYYFSKGHINNDGLMESVKEYKDYNSMLGYLNTGHPSMEMKPFLSLARIVANKLENPIPGMRKMSNICLWYLTKMFKTK